MRTLFITNKVPYPLDTGTNQRVYHLLKAVAEVSEVTLVFSTQEGQEEAELTALRPFYSKAYVFRRESLAWYRDSRCPRLRRWARKAGRSLDPTEPLLLKLFSSDEGARLVRRVWAEGFDLVWAERLTSLPLLPSDLQGGGSRVIVDVDDVEHRKLGYRLRRGRMYRSWPLDCLEYLKLRRWERGILRLPYEFLVCSALDREMLGNRDRVWVLPNGVELRGEATLNEGQAKRADFLFVGTMSYLPNVDAVEFFARRVLPLIKRRLPGARFLIVGSEPTPGVRRLHDGQSVIVTGTVPRVEPYLRSAAVVVVPLRFAGGTRLKILEAMAHRKPVVATAVGAEGLEVQSGRHLLIADGATAFAKACITLYEDSDLQRRLGGEAYEQVKRHYDWREIERQVRQIVVGGIEGVRACEYDEDQPALEGTKRRPA